MSGRGTALVKAVEAALSWRKDVTIWRQNTGAVALKAPGEARRFVSFGLPGCGDLTGIGPRGVRIEIECKDGEGRPTKRQRAFGEMIRAHGGIYLLVRSVDDAIRQLDEALGSRSPPPVRAA